MWITYKSSIYNSCFLPHMKQKIQMSLEEEPTKQLDKNLSYYLMEKMLTDFYRMGLIDYYGLVKVLGPQRSFELQQIMRSARKFKQWINM